MSSDGKHDLDIMEPEKSLLHSLFILFRGWFTSYVFVYVQQKSFLKGNFNRKACVSHIEMGRNILDKHNHRPSPT